MYLKKTEIRITFKIKTGYYLELLMPKTIKILRSNKKNINKNKNGETFLIQKSLKQYQFIVILLTAIIYAIQEFYIQLFQTNHLVTYQIFHSKILLFLRTFNSEFSYNEVWFNDQNYNTLEVEDKINITLVIN